MAYVVLVAACAVRLLRTRAKLAEADGGGGGSPQSARRPCAVARAPSPMDCAVVCAFQPDAGGDDVHFHGRSGCAPALGLAAWRCISSRSFSRSAPLRDISRSGRSRLPAADPASCSARDTRMKGRCAAVVLIHLTVFFLAALSCHRQLADERPHAFAPHGVLSSSSPLAVCRVVFSIHLPHRFSSRVSSSIRSCRCWSAFSALSA